MNVSRRGHFCTGTLLAMSIGLALMSSCMKNSNTVSDGSSGAKGTPAEAENFINGAENELFDLNVKYSRADWVKSTFITDDTEALSADANNAVIVAVTDFVDQSRRFDGLDLP